MEKSSVIVVDDSRFMRKIITDIIEADAQFTVVGTAENGKEAITLIDSLKPDIVTLDLEMPEMDGIEALQLILKKHRIPIIMLSGISESNTRDTIRALQYGAFDFIRKPTSVGGNAHDIVSTGELLVEKMKTAVLTKRRKSVYQPIVIDTVLEPKKETKYEPKSIDKNTETKLIDKNKETKLLDRSKEAKLIDINKETKQILSNLVNKNETKLISNKNIFKENIQKDNSTIIIEKDSTTKEKISVKPINTENSKSSFSSDRPSKPLNNTKVTQIVAIGTSTGGPRALHEVISNIPAGISAPIVVVQHMPPKFTKSLAQRLDHFSELTVVEAEEHMELRNGQVYIAPGGYHMKVNKRGTQYYISLSTEPPRNGHRPSVDVLFESLLDFKELERHIVLMTGMGSDGAQGMKSLYEQGVNSTIAESEQSCVVYGMPRSAVELGVVDKVLPLSQIAPEIVRKVMKRALN